MDLKVGDRVRTESGEVGKVFHIDRMTVFVALAVPGESDRISAYLESDLARIDRPDSNEAGENMPMGNL